MWLYAVTRLAGPKANNKAGQNASVEKAIAQDTFAEPNKHGDRVLPRSPSQLCSSVPELSPESRRVQVVELSQVTQDGLEVDFTEIVSDHQPLPLRPVPVELSWTDVSYKVLQGQPGKGKASITKQIVRPCSGRLRAGQAAALMGPSGAGKPADHI